MGIVIGVIVIILILLTIPRYNHLRRLKNAVEEAKANIGVQLIRRRELIMNLVELVRGYTKHERVVLSTVVGMRSGRGLPEEGEIHSITARELFALAEQYPDLKASTNFIRLAEDLADTENRVALSRECLNKAVKEFNDARSTLPNLILLGWLFKKELYFELTSGAEEPISVSIPLPDK